eukprot:1369887-Pyramimonas_sp.AAC.2
MVLHQLARLHALAQHSSRVRGGAGRSRGRPPTRGPASLLQEGINARQTGVSVSPRAKRVKRKGTPLRHQHQPPRRVRVASSYSPRGHSYTTVGNDAFARNEGRVCASVGEPRRP